MNVTYTKSELSKIGSWNIIETGELPGQGNTLPCIIERICENKAIMSVRVLLELMVQKDRRR